MDRIVILGNYTINLERFIYSEIRESKDRRIKPKWVFYFDGAPPIELDEREGMPLNLAIHEYVMAPMPRHLKPTPKAKAAGSKKSSGRDADLTEEVAG